MFHLKDLYHAEQQYIKGAHLYQRPYKQSQKEIDITVPKIRYERLQEEMKGLSQDFEYVLGKARLVKSSFGKPYLKLEISRSELARYKRKASKIISGQ